MGNGYKEIEVEQGKELSIKTENFFKKDSFFEDVYRRANRLVNEIIVQAAVFENDYKDDRNTINKNYRSDGHDFFSEYGNNVIIFSGKRGEGKTSALHSFSHFLEYNDRNEKSYSDFWNIKRYCNEDSDTDANSGKCDDDIPCTKNADFITLDPIDPRLLKSTDSIVRIVLSQLFFLFQEELEAESDYEPFYADEIMYPNSIDRERYQPRAEWNQTTIARIYHEFEQCYKLLSYIKEKKGQREISSLEDMAAFGVSTRLQRHLYNTTLQLLNK